MADAEKKKQTSLVEILAQAGTSGALAQAEQLTGIPFFQQSIARQERRAATQEQRTANSARLRAGLNTGLVTQADVESAGGFDALSGSEAFDATYGDLLRSAEQRSTEADADEADKQNAIIQATELGIAGDLGAMTTHEIRSASATELARRDQQARETTATDGDMKGLDAATNNLLADPNIGAHTIESLARLEAEQLQRLENRGQLDPGTRSLMAEQIKSKMRVAQETGTRLIRVNDIQRSVSVGGPNRFDLLTESKDDPELRVAAGNTATVAKEVAVLDSKLKDISVVQSNPELVKELRADPNLSADLNAVLDFIDSMPEGRVFTGDTLVDAGDGLANALYGLDTSRVNAEADRVIFATGPLEAERNEFDLMLEGLTEDTAKFMFPNGLPDSETVFSAQIGDKGEWSVRTNEAVLAPAEQKLQSGGYTFEELADFDARSESITAAFPSAKPFAEAVAQQLRAHVREGVQPSEVALAEATSRQKSAAESVSHTLISTVGKNADAARLGYDVKVPVFVPQLQALTRPTAESLDTLSRKLETAQLQANLGGSQFEEAQALNEVAVAQRRVNDAQRRAVFGRPVETIMDAIAASDGGDFDTLGAALDSFLPPVDSGGPTGKGPQTKYGPMLEEVASLSPQKQQAAVQAILDEAAHDIVLAMKGPQFEADDVTFLRLMFNEQFDVFDDTPANQAMVDTLRTEQDATRAVYGRDGNVVREHKFRRAVGFDSIRPDDWTGTWIDKIKVLGEMRSDN